MNSIDSKCKSLINKIKNHEQESLLIVLAKTLLLSEDNFVNGGPNPFILLKMIRFAIEYAGDNAKRIQVHSFSQLTDLYNLFLDFDDSYFDASEFKKEFGPDKFFRLKAHEQFWFQENISNNDIGRLLLIFDGLPKKSKILSHIKKETSLELESFLEISFLFFAYFNTMMSSNSAPFVDFDFLSAINYEKAQLDSYIKLLATSLEEQKITIKKHKQGKKDYSCFSTSFREPFPVKIITPMFIINNKYLIYSKQNFYYFYKYHIYHLIKTNVHAHERWGKRFEIYVAKLLNNCDINYIPEKTLKKEFTGKVVDFLHPDKNNNILFECKAVEMPPTAQIKQDNQTLKENTKHSIIKAVQQAFAVINSAKNTAIDGVCQTDNFSLIIITYKKLMLPQGKRLWDEYLSKIEFDYYDPSRLPAENIYLMSISEFEYFLTSNDIYESLNIITEKEKDPKATRLFIGDYLSENKLINLEKISFIEERFKKCVNKLLHKSFDKDLLLAREQRNVK